MMLKMLLLVFLAVQVFAFPQKLSDDPRDRPIQVRHDGAKQSDVLCYAPVFTKGEGYIYLDYCTSKSVKSARYDVFGRIAYKLDDKWLCLTAPSSVTGIDGKSTEQWDYLILRPCVINDKNQQWRIENNAIYTADKRFRVKDYKYYAYITKDSKSNSNHKLTEVMDTWIQTIARPANLSIKTPLAWLFSTQSTFGVYYIQNNQSTADQPVNLYYNPENGHLAQYYADSGKLYCLTSNTRPNEDWNWTSWKSCNDQVSKEADKARYWELFAMNNNEGMLRDYWGNILRVTTYGPNWGVPYAVKEKYLKKDTQNTPTSNFIFSHDIDAWNRFSYANLAEDLTYCPAPGGTPIRKRVKRNLPQNFQLTDAWIGRLWQISISTDPTQPRDGIGLCGVCLLQSYQMAMEMINYSEPVSRGGYYFDTAPDVNPFISLSQRFPQLADRLEVTYDFANRDFGGGDPLSTRIARAVYAMTIGMMPQYIITPSTMVTGGPAITGLLQDMIDSPVGSVFIVTLYRTGIGGVGNSGHAQVSIRLQEGLVLIPTNDVDSLQSFREQLTPTTDVNVLINALTLEGERQLTAVQTLRIQRPFENPLSVILSQNNCTGAGEDRRGSGTLPSSALVNQCASGRCFQ